MEPSAPVAVRPSEDDDLDANLPADSARTFLPRASLKRGQILLAPVPRIPYEEIIGQHGVYDGRCFTPIEVKFSELVETHSFKPPSPSLIYDTCGHKRTQLRIAVDLWYSQRDERAIQRVVVVLIILEGLPKGRSAVETCDAIGRELTHMRGPSNAEKVQLRRRMQNRLH